MGGLHVPPEVFLLLLEHGRPYLLGLISPIQQKYGALQIEYTAFHQNANNQLYGIYCFNEVDAAVNWCNIYGHAIYGIFNPDSDYVIDAENNWWGDPSGPAGYGPGTGDPVSDYVDYDPWLADSVQSIGIEEQQIVQLEGHDNFISATVFRGPLQLPEGSKCKVFDITGRTVRPDMLKPGVYFIQIDGELVQKVIKVR